MPKKHNIDSLNLSYTFSRFNNKDIEMCDVVNTFIGTRIDLVKEVGEYFGLDLGDDDYEYNYQNEYKFDPDLDVDIDLTKDKEDLLMGILKYADTLNSLSGDGQWSKAVIEMASWYATNIHEYNQGKTSFCSLVNRDVRWDCSGFTTACLWNYGALLDIDHIPCSAEFTNSVDIGRRLEEAGFAKYAFTPDDVLPFDIITFPGHVEIYNEKIAGKHTSYSWGKCHDWARGGLPCLTVSIKKYHVIWRNVKNGRRVLRLENLDYTNYQGGVISLDKLMEIYPNANRQIAGATLAAIDRYASVIGLSDKGKLFLLAQMAHESAGFRTMEEYGSGTKYEGRSDLGNTIKGDGPRFKGRGPIQITGRSNYTIIRDKYFPMMGLSHDIVSNPEILSQYPELGAAASIAWCMMPGNGKRAVKAANAGDVIALTKAINGGTNGLQDREQKTKQILAAASLA